MVPGGRGWRRSNGPGRWITTGVVVVISIWSAAVAFGPPTTAGAAASKAASTRTRITPAVFRLAGPKPSPDQQLRVWLLGDSVLHDASPALADALAATGDATVVADSTFGGWGLTIQKAWVQDSLQIIDAWHPQVVIGTWSWDDSMAEAQPKAYAALLRRALGVWMTPGDGVELVVLVEFPQVGPNGLIRAAKARQRWWVQRTTAQDDWNRIARAVAADFRGHAVYLSTDPVFEPGGRYFTWVRTTSGSWVRARQVDDTHLCPYGVLELTQLVMSDLEPVLGLSPPGSAWTTGSWTLDPRLDNGPASCPDDQPPRDYRGLPVPRPAHVPKSGA